MGRGEVWHDLLPVPFSQQYVSMTWSDDVGEAFTKTTWNSNTVADYSLQSGWLTLCIAQFLKKKKKPAPHMYLDGEIIISTLDLVLMSTDTS